MEAALAIDSLDAAATLAAVEGELVTRRTAEARDLALAAHWADLHASDPQLGPGGRRAWRGEDRLVQVGGDGTPEVAELSIVELSVSRRVHPHAGRKVVADALDLRHRLPSWWVAVHELRIEPWIARKAATLSRDLDAVAVRVVDAALPEDLGEVSPARILEVVRAKIIEADPVRHAAALDDDKRRRYVSLSRTDEFGLRHVIARVRAGDAVWIDAMVDRVAEILAPRFPAGTTQDVLRSEAFGWLARPAELLQLLLEATDAPTLDQEGLAEALRTVDPRRLRPQVVLYVHLHEAAVRADRGVARIEEIGPLLSREVPEWLGHAHVTVRPVLDLADQAVFDAYEHPESLTERIHLRSPADSFPHANQVTRRLDRDHVEPWVPGHTGQTGDHNSQPRGRTGHRAKTTRRPPGPTTRAGRPRLADPSPSIPSRRPPRHHGSAWRRRLRADVGRPRRPSHRTDDPRRRRHRTGIRPARGPVPQLVSRLTRSATAAAVASGSISRCRWPAPSSCRYGHPWRTASSSSGAYVDPNARYAHRRPSHPVGTGTSAST